MDIIIACIGHMKPSPELDLLSKYIKQTRWNVVVREFEDKKPGSVEERKNAKALFCFPPFPPRRKSLSWTNGESCYPLKNSPNGWATGRTKAFRPLLFDRRRGRTQRRNQAESRSDFGVRRNDLAAYVGARHAGRTNLPGKNYFGRTPVPPSIKDISLSI